MAFENNIPKIKNNFGVDGMRDISARRAATISNMIEEAGKTGHRRFLCEDCHRPLWCRQCESHACEHEGSR